MQVRAQPGLWKQPSYHVIASRRPPVQKQRRTRASASAWGPPSLVSVWLGWRATRGSRGARGAQEEPATATVTGAVLDLPDGLEVFRSSLARCCGTAEEVGACAKGLEAWRAWLLGGGQAAQAPASAPASAPAWPPEPLGPRLLAAARDLDLPALLLERPELVDSVLLNVLQAVEDFSRSVASQGQGENGEPEAGGGLSLWGLSLSSGAASASEAAGAVQADQDAAQEASDPSGNVAEAAGDGEQSGNTAEGDAGAAGAAGAAGDSSPAKLDADLGGDSAEGPDAESAESVAEQLAQQFAETWEAAAAEAGRPSLRSWTPPNLLNLGPGAAGEKPQSPEEAFASGTGTAPGRWSAPKGWEHLLVLRQLLGRLPELQKLVRKMGRRSGLKSSLRLERAQREKAKEAEGVVRSPRAPCETSGITRSDGSLLLLPSELSLMAYANQPWRPSAGGARALHRLRRAESALLSYERSAWLEGPAETLRWREFRPAQERGPLLCCVDTSRSMAGRREAIAKAAVLEVLLLAEAERRPCHLCFFAGPGDLAELEVPPAPIPAKAWEQVLSFLSRSFGGGTDLEAPLAASARRLKGDWGAADVLLVTDGEVEAPPPALLKELQELREDGGLRVFGLTVAEPEQRESSGMASLKAICDEAPCYL